MSRIGKKPIIIPEGVEVKIEGNVVKIKGPKGELSREIRPEIKVEVNENKVLVSPQVEVKGIKAIWGLTRALLANMIKGVKEGFEKKLEIQGLGFKANLEDADTLLLHVGFTNPIRIKGSPGIKFSVEKNIIIISGQDFEKVSQIAAKIRKIKPPEPYKGKGIRYLGEEVRKKMGKKAVAATAG